MSDATHVRTRVGVDVARASDVHASLEAFGPRYLHRVFTDHEIAACAGSDVVRDRGLAARFAAKEALLKVLRVGDVPVDWREVEVRRTLGGWPELVLHGELAKLADAAGLHDSSVSMTHDDDLSMAVVVAACTEPHEAAEDRPGADSVVGGPDVVEHRPMPYPTGGTT
jgi:holo-[acyl-carrier protein] synthase